MNLFPRLALSGLLLLALNGASSSAQAQSVLNAIRRPAWGPEAPTGKQYYYIPEVGGYYDLRDQRYLVPQNGRWARVTNVEGRDPNTFHPVVIDYVGAQPWSQIRTHRTQYPSSLPPGQVKRLKNGKGLPPGQAKKQNRGYGYDDRYERDDDDRNDDRGYGKSKDKGKHKDKD